MKGFRYRVTKKTILNYLKLTPEQRLEWLEEINTFLYTFMPKQNREIMQKFRAGEI
ncbi:MAG: hypothetical protein QXH26_03870 [Candidatus Hadarchaeales archaeon]